MQNGTSLELRNIVNANWVCAGYNTYNITMETSDGFLYETTVAVGNSSSGLVYDVELMRPAKFYPMKEESPVRSAPCIAPEVLLTCTHQKCEDNIENQVKIMRVEFEFSQIGYLSVL
ncbi:hypothetical protein TIFTF001_000323 [Ficus carica]|uniref:Uncharacterized protein n=1 Tax=Ficus carica TaxID=3494 RepID=A0AA88D0Y3_FICCA|nr:hypothetical protein TIFTF001_000323 [Ficus carica]